MDGGGGVDSVEFEGPLADYTVTVESSSEGEGPVVTVTDTVEDRDEGLNDGVTIMYKGFDIIWDHL